MLLLTKTENYIPEKMVRLIDLSIIAFFKYKIGIESVKVIYVVTYFEHLDKQYDLFVAAIHPASCFS